MEREHLATFQGRAYDGQMFTVKVFREPGEPDPERDLDWAPPFPVSMRTNHGHKVFRAEPGAFDALIDARPIRFRWEKWIEPLRDGPGHPELARWLGTEMPQQQ